MQKAIRVHPWTKKHFRQEASSHTILGKKKLSLQGKPFVPFVATKNHAPAYKSSNPQILKS